MTQIVKSSLGQEDPLEKEMTTHSNTLAWKILWMEERGRLQSTVSQRDMTEQLHLITKKMRIFFNTKDKNHIIFIQQSNS